MVGKTLNTEVQEEGLQTDKNRCSLQKANFTATLNLKMSFKDQKGVTEHGCKCIFNYCVHSQVWELEREAHSVLHSLITSELTFW